VIKLSEQEIARQFNISRTPAREALVKLADIGLVESIPYKGTFISKISFKKLDEILFIRQTLEIQILKELNNHITKEELKKCHINLQAQRQSINNNDIKLFFQLDEEFHQLLYTIAGFGGVFKMIQTISVHYNRIRYLTIYSPKHEIMYQEHLDILSAIENKNIDQAIIALQSHLNKIQFEKEQLLKEYNNFFIE